MVIVSKPWPIGDPASPQPTYPGDSRFYPGYHWVYDSDPMCGWCMPGPTPRQAIERWADGIWRQYWQKQRTITLYSLAGPDAEPVAHQVEVGGRDR